MADVRVQGLGRFLLFSGGGFAFHHEITPGNLGNAFFLVARGRLHTRTERLAPDGTFGVFPEDTDSKVCPCQSVRKETVKRIRRQLGIAHRMGNVPMPKVLLDVARVVPIIRQLEPDGVSQHVRMHREGEPGLLACPGHYPTHRGCSQRPTTLGREYEPASGVFSLQLA